MPATIIRASSAQGLTLLESGVEVAEDGFVTIETTFLAPASGYNPLVFALDSPWPQGISLPVGLPTLQGGPFLLNHSVKKQNALEMVRATYVSALNPIRVITSESTDRLSFSGFVGTTSTFFGTNEQSLSFDYYTMAQTISFALIAPNISEIKPEGKIGERFNVRSEGVAGLIQLKETEFITTSRTTVGKVTRISSTARRILEQESPPTPVTSVFSGGVAGVNFPNPWQNFF